MNEAPKIERSFLIFLALTLVLHGFLFFQATQSSSFTPGAPSSSALLLQALEKVSLKQKTIAPTLPLKPIPQKKVKELAESATPTQQTESAPASVNSEQRQQQLLDYTTELTLRIEQNKYYPVMSRRLKQTGRVVVSFDVTKKGTIKNVQLAQASSYPLLNEAALTAVKKVKKFKPLPESLQADVYSYSVPLVFTLY